MKFEIDIFRQNLTSNTSTTPSTTPLNRESVAQQSRPSTLTSNSSPNPNTHRRGHKHGATPRRPLRTPSSSPLTMSNSNYTSTRSRFVK